MVRRLYVWTIGDVRYDNWDHLELTLERLHHLTQDIRLFSFNRPGVELRSVVGGADLRGWRFAHTPRNPWWPVDALVKRRELGYDTVVAWFCAGGDTLTSASIRAAHSRGLEVWTSRQSVLTA